MLPIRRMLDSSGQPISFTLENDLLLVDTACAGDTHWLEWLGDATARLHADAVAAMPVLGDVEYDEASSSLLRPSHVNLDADRFEICRRAEQFSTQVGFDTLIGLSQLRGFEPLEHQILTARTVLQRMRGRALLCDEVGMGKTIEAGLILLELLRRGLARNVLVITPPALIEQWRGEMSRKFGIELSAQAADTPNSKRTEWCNADRVIASIHTAKRDPYRSALLARKWDLVIVDEAHHLRNRNTMMWKFASEIEKRAILLLTATPVQNNLEELFNLVTLLEPGLLSTNKDFARRFVDKKDAMTPRNVDELHGLLAEVMVRNRRATSGLHFTQRFARTEAVAMVSGEQQVHDALAKQVRSLLAAKETDGATLPRMTLLTLQMAIGSSTAAAAQVLENLFERGHVPKSVAKPLREVLEQARSQTRHAKLDRLCQILDASDSDEKLVLFTEFRATQDLIARHLSERGHDVVVFHGGLSRMEKEHAVEAFRDQSRVLICTQAGSEGRNLQFAHVLCNYDLPWNPMKIEQRIGRLSRIGQKHDVQVINLVARGTIEQAVLHLLDAKLSMFELVIGEIDMILGNLEDDRDFPEVIADAWAGSSGDDEFAARMELLGNQLLAAKVDYMRQKAFDEKIFGGRFSPDR